MARRKKERKNRRRNVRANNTIPLPAGRGGARERRGAVAREKVRPVPFPARFAPARHSRPSFQALLRSSGQTAAATVCQTSRDYPIDSRNDARFPRQIRVRRSESAGASGCSCYRRIVRLIVGRFYIGRFAIAAIELARARAVEIKAGRSRGERRAR